MTEKGATKTEEEMRRTTADKRAIKIAAVWPSGSNNKYLLLLLLKGGESRAMTRRAWNHHLSLQSGMLAPSAIQQECRQRHSGSCPAGTGIIINSPENCVKTLAPPKRWPFFCLIPPHQRATGTASPWFIVKIIESN